MRHYCTLFDQKYLPQGLALYESLVRHTSAPFRLWILALDLDTWQALTKLRLPYAEIIPLESFEHAAGLREIRASRTWQEYCWTLASQFTESLIHGGLLECTYVDADTFFFSDPAPAFAEIGMRPIAITPHRLIPSKKYLEVNGIFNVGFVHFKSTPAGRKCLDEWAANCRAWCFNRVEGDKFGDQKYLDRWPADYGQDCCVIEHIGVNAGPWSLGNWKVTAGPRLDDVSLICYHAHEFDYEQRRLTNYELRPEDIALIYEPYLEAFREAKERIEAVLIPA